MEIEMTQILPANAPKSPETRRSRLFVTVGRAAMFMGALAIVPSALSLAHIVEAKAEQPAASQAIDQTRPVSFADLAAKVTPAVVNISSSRKVAESDGQELPQFPKGSPFEDFFKQFEEQQRQGNGRKQ